MYSTTPSHRLRISLHHLITYPTLTPLIHQRIGSVPAGPHLPLDFLPLLALNLVCEQSGMPEFAKQLAPNYNSATT